MTPRTTRVLAGLAAALSIGLAAPLAQAAPTLRVSGNGILLGADGVLVDGLSYDVRFVDGTCNGLFNGCSPSAFAFTTQAAATDAAQALLDTVFVDGALGNFDSHPELTSGCSSSYDCYAAIAYDAQQRGGSPGVATVLGGNTQAGNFPVPLVLLADRNLTGEPNFTWAVFTRSATVAALPEPASVALWFAGAGALLAVSRKRRSASPSTTAMSA